MRGACTPSRERGLYGTLIQFRFLSLLEVRVACTPFRARRLYRPRGTLFQSLLECVGPVPPFAGVVFTDPEERSFRLSILSLLECLGPVPPSAGVVCTDPAGRSSAAA